MDAAADLGGTFTFPGTSITVRRMGYGAMQLAGPNVFGPPRDPDAALAVLVAAVASGIDHIDTSDFYGPHVTNRLISRALKPYPRGLTLVTKVGARRGSDGSWIPDSSPGSLRQAIEDNLRNLGLDVLPIVNLRVGGVRAPNDASIVAPLTTLAELQQRGKHRQDDRFLDHLHAAGVAYVPFFPLGGFTPLQSSILDEVAATLHASPFAVALAWLLQRSPNLLLIPGTSSLAHLQENISAASIRLTAGALQKLDAVGGTTAI